MTQEGIKEGIKEAIEELADKHAIGVYGQLEGYDAFEDAMTECAIDTCIEQFKAGAAAAIKLLLAEMGNWAALGEGFCWNKDEKAEKLLNHIIQWVSPTLSDDELWNMKGVSSPILTSDSSEDKDG